RVRDLEPLRRRARVDVLAAPERLDNRGVARQVGEDAELDLRVVGGDEPPPLLRDERGADPPAELGPGRDVHEVRVLRGEPPGRRHELVERRVDAAGARDRRGCRGAPCARAPAPGGARSLRRSAKALCPGARRPRAPSTATPTSRVRRAPAPAPRRWGPGRAPSEWGAGAGTRRTPRGT